LASLEKHHVNQIALLHPTHEGGEFVREDFVGRIDEDSVELELPGVELDHPLVDTVEDESIIFPCERKALETGCVLHHLHPETLGLRQVTNHRSPPLEGTRVRRE